jgi:phosphoglycolate phosphatase
MSSLAAGSLADSAIIFDLDGTLVDSAPDLARAVNETLDLEGLPHINADQTRRMVGQGARVLIERAALLGGVKFSAERFEALTKAFIEFYRADIARETTVFPGVPEALKELSDAGAKLAVCTNKRTDLSGQLLTALGLATHFSAVVGSDAVANKKPHPDHFRAAVQRAGGALRRAVMIGDTAADVGTAKSAGAPIILVRFGYAEGEVDGLGADAVLDRFHDVPLMCARLLHGRI